MINNYFYDNDLFKSTDSTTTPRGYVWSTTVTDDQALLKLTMQRTKSTPNIPTRQNLNILEEFRRIGIDTPYYPDEDHLTVHKNDSLSTIGSPSTYLRQKSWPEPDRTPVHRLKRAQFMPTAPKPDFGASKENQLPGYPRDSYFTAPSSLTEEQIRVLSTLPDSVLYSLLKQMEKSRGKNIGRAKNLITECRFCRSNGERDAFVRSHPLRDQWGRIACPVLRNHVCTRCGARGDGAHTIKYCPYSTEEERKKSDAIMRSMRMASGRPRYRNQQAFGNAENYKYHESNIPFYNMPLDPLWAALERKLAM